MIRPTTLADLAAVDALLARSYPKLLKEAYPPSVLVTALPLMSRAQPKLLKCGTYYAVIRDGEIVGAGGWTPDRAKRGLGHIRHIVSDHRLVRQGIGRALLDHIKAEARRAGIVEMECWATRNAVPFYMSVGFQKLGLIDVQLQPGITFPSVRMHMGLADGG